MPSRNVRAADGRKAMKTMPYSIVIFTKNIAVRTSTISVIGEAKPTAGRVRGEAEPRLLLTFELPSKQLKSVIFIKNITVRYRYFLLGERRSLQPGDYEAKRSPDYRSAVRGPRKI